MKVGWDVSERRMYWPPENVVDRIQTHHLSTEVHLVLSTETEDMHNLSDLPSKHLGTPDPPIYIYIYAQSARHTTVCSGPLPKLNTKCQTHHHYHTSKIHLVLFIKLNTHTHTHTQSIPPNTCPINDKVLLPTETEHTQSIAHTCPLRPTLTSLQEVNTCKAWDPHFKNEHL